jgi:predicted RND superfamily exporter protein
MTATMGYLGSKVNLSYEFTRAIPLDNPKYLEYQSFRQKFGDDGATLVLGIESDSFYSQKLFNQVGEFHKNLKKVIGVEEVLSIPEVIALKKDTINNKLIAQKIFHYPYSSQQQLDSDRAVFENLPFYRSLLYNANIKDTAHAKAYLLAVRLNKDSVNSASRIRLVNDINDQADIFEKISGITLHKSGLPFIRTTLGSRTKKELKWFLFGSVLLSAITLLIFFRSIGAMFISLFVVLNGVLWSVGTLYIFSYKISILTALIPPLVVVIGVPNCIYFLNKYHTTYRETGDKNKALVTMVGRMGIVTLFCNIAAAIGFAVFSLTRSALLKEFGVVAGINIMALFFISLIFIPSILSYLPAPKPRHMKYLDNKFFENILLKVEVWALHSRKTIYTAAFILTVLAVIGIFKIKSEGFMVDDLPQNDKVYTDLKWFEKNFEGVMPLEIVVDTKKKKGLFRKLETLEKIDSFSAYIAAKPETARPLSFVEGLKFVEQAFHDGDSSSYIVPPVGDMLFLKDYLQSDSSGKNNNAMVKLLKSFVYDGDTTHSSDTTIHRDSTQMARISVNMKDIGSAKLPILLNDLETKARTIFDTSSYKLSFTGTSVTFLEGSSFIIKGLKDSITYAFILITLCMLYLFRSFRILICSLIPNLIPLVFTAGLMGWLHIRLAPSTVLVFSVALGIVIDVTIRFLVNYKQELPNNNGEVEATLIQTIRHTGLSIIYTSLVLIAGFIIFCFSDFGGTRSLGWLTSFTLVVGTLTNLILLPVLIISTSKTKK